MGRQLKTGARAPEARDAMDAGETRPVLSVVVPCCNEEAVLRETNCRLVSGSEYFARYEARYFGLQIVRRDYIVFFPRLLSWLRPLEPRLSRCLAGAQYALAAGRTAHV
jgi:hypothetical protein